MTSILKDKRKVIRQLISVDTGSAYFTPGDTDTGANLLLIASHLHPREAVIAATSVHIVGKEGGATDATRQKTLKWRPREPSAEGRLTPKKIQSAFD